MGTIRVRTLATRPDAPAPDRVLAALPRDAAPVLLDSSNGGGWSLLAWQPEQRTEARLRPRAEGAAWPLADRDPGAVLARAMAGEAWLRDDPEPPLAGGWIGWFGFECGHAYERYPWAPQPHAWPDYGFARFRRAIAWAPDGTAHLLWGEPLDHPAAAPPERDELLSLWPALLRAARRAPAARPADANARPGPLHADLTRQEYGTQVERLRSWIGTGELYQANLTHALRGRAPSDPRACYRAIRAAQPTAMSAFWETSPSRALLSWSPERFLRVEGERLLSEPIKGTARRHADPVLDRSSVAALEASEKERAELTMIVDMSRNDLGRVARAGSVHTRSAGHVESYPTVHHRTGVVEARWDPRLGIAALLRATFPPASVTGAPKVRALRAIVELEQRARGPYCGSLFAWEPGATPRADFNVLIRTASLRDGAMEVGVGAGIVWDSDPVAEWHETLLKARYLEGAHEDSRAATVAGPIR